MTSNCASSFAPYIPPPDDSTYRLVPSSSSKAQISYQSGGIPTFNNSTIGHEDIQEDGQYAQWETSYGLRVDVLSAFAYLLGPVSALTLLVLETHNDYVRFHAYQSALLMAPLLLLRIFASLVSFPSWIQTCFSIILTFSALFMAVRAYLGASSEGLARYHVPKIGRLAETWVFEE